MLFGKIDYLNLLPFHIYLKKQPICQSIKKSSEFYAKVPSAINKRLKRRKIDSAFISSIESSKRGLKHLPFGIVANKNVWSVIVKPGNNKNDPASATSNALAKILNIQGEVFIGDRALQMYLKNPTEYIDLAQKWHVKTSLPFVFARLCSVKNTTQIKNITKNFTKKPIKIPQYIIEKESIKRKIPKSAINKYLKLIYYQIGPKEKLALEHFLRKVRIDRKDAYDIISKN